jgi:hypothetical protein
MKWTSCTATVKRDALKRSGYDLGECCELIDSIERNAVIKLKRKF